MRCKKCRKEITGIGKPAVSPALPAILAWGGAIWAMWSLTLGENPLPSWSPTPGWAVGLGTLAVATVLGWYALTRRKCPECGSRQMFEAMEEEAVLATERQMALEQARNGARPGLEPDRQTLRAEIEVEVRTAAAKEKAELRGRLEKELRDEMGQQMRASQAESEREMRQKLANEVRAEVEKELRPRVEARLRPEIERELRPEIERELRPEIEKELRSEIERELRPRIEEKLRPEIERELRASLPKPTQAEPEKPKTSPPVVESTSKASPDRAKNTGKPVVREAAPTPARTPSPLAAKGQGTIPRFLNPSPLPGMTGSAGAKAATPVLARTPSPVSVKPAAPLPSKSPGATPAPATSKSAMTPSPGPALDPRERAERRARVIVSDLSLYHKDLLTKAAQAADAKKELGTLWRDAVLAYDRTVPQEVRNTTHYLEDELEKYLTQLRQNQAAPAGPPRG
jgi:hypothetical protein